MQEPVSMYDCFFIFYLLSMHIPLNCPSLIYFECWGPLPLFHLAHHSLERDDKWHQRWVETTSSPHFSSGIARASEAAQRVKITPREKGEKPFHEISFDAQLKTRSDIAKTSFPGATLRYDDVPWKCRLTFPWHQKNFLMKIWTSQM